jgi:hypothetical protein
MPIGVDQREFRIMVAIAAAAFQPDRRGGIIEETEMSRRYVIAGIYVLGLYFVAAPAASQQAPADALPVARDSSPSCARPTSSS